MRTDRDRRVLHARDLVGRIVAVEGDDHGDYFLVYADGKRILVDCGYVGATLVEICPSRASIDAAILPGQLPDGRTVGGGLLAAERRPPRRGPDADAPHRGGGGAAMTRRPSRPRLLPDRRPLRPTLAERLLAAGQRLRAAETASPTTFTMRYAAERQTGGLR